MIVQQTRETPLHWSVKRGYKTLTSILLENGANPDSSDSVSTGLILKC